MSLNLPIPLNSASPVQLSRGMSEANLTNRVDRFTNVCTQCNEGIPASTVSRHAIPCGHLVCGTCVDKLEAERKDAVTTVQACRSAGCKHPFTDFDLWIVASCTRRSARLARLLTDLVSDQGDRGASPDSAAPLPAPNCVECGPDPDTGATHAATHRCRTCNTECCDQVAALHPRLKASRGHDVRPLPRPKAERTPESKSASERPGTDVGAVETAATLPGTCPMHNQDFIFESALTSRPVCAECLVSLSTPIPVKRLSSAQTPASIEEAMRASVAKQRNALMEISHTVEGYRDELNAWGTAAKARMTTWAAVVAREAQNLVAQCAADVDDIVSSRVGIVTSALAQRIALRVTLDEISYELLQPETKEPEAAALRQVLERDQDMLVSMLARGIFKLIPARTFTSWAHLPSLGDGFSEGAPVEFDQATRSAKLYIHLARRACPGFSADLPVMPDLVGTRVCIA